MDFQRTQYQFYEALSALAITQLILFTLPTNNDGRFAKYQGASSGKPLPVMRSSLWHYLGTLLPHDRTLLNTDYACMQSATANHDIKGR